MTTYKIATLPHYYHPDIQGNERPRLDGDFDTIKDARAEINKRESETYYLQHGESGRPTLLVVDERTADYVECGRGQDMSNYDWDNAECGCGECNTCFEMMITQDRDYLRSRSEK